MVHCVGVKIYILATQSHTPRYGSVKGQPRNRDNIKFSNVKALVFKI